MRAHKKQLIEWILLVVFWLSVIPGWSQEKTPFAEENTYITVSGVVKDKQNRKTLEYVNVSSGHAIFSKNVDIRIQFSQYGNKRKPCFDEKCNKIRLSDCFPLLVFSFYLHTVIPPCLSAMPAQHLLLARLPFPQPALHIQAVV